MIAHKKCEYCEKGDAIICIGEAGGHVNTHETLERMPHNARKRTKMN
jgi:hypothetical protein